MDVSKVTFTEQTKAKLQNPVLGNKKRAQLKRELIKEYIRSKPSGTKISISELIAAAQYPKEKRHAGYQFVQKTIKAGHIIREDIPKSSKSYYYVPEDAKPAQSTVVEKAIDLGQEIEKHNTVVKDKPIYSFGDDLDVNRVEEMAKNFTWNTGSFDLREFVGWLKK